MNNTYVIPDAIWLKVNSTDKGICFQMVDKRMPMDITVDFYVEDEADELEFMNVDGLFRIECTLGIALANIIMAQAVLN